MKNYWILNLSEYLLESLILLKAELCLNWDAMLFLYHSDDYVTSDSGDLNMQIRKWNSVCYRANIYRIQFLILIFSLTSSCTPILISHCGAEFAILMKSMPKKKNMKLTYQEWKLFVAQSYLNRIVNFVPNQICQTRMY